jgi:hypothetical protein
VPAPPVVSLVVRSARASAASRCCASAASRFCASPGPVSARSDDASRAPPVVLARAPPSLAPVVRPPLDPLEPPLVPDEVLLDEVLLDEVLLDEVLLDEVLLDGSAEPSGARLSELHAAARIVARTKEIPRGARVIRPARSRSFVARQPATARTYRLRREPK